ncbi:MAG: GreA/GreB family elongation factor, partial [Acidithiobacillales bacterium]
PSIESHLSGKRYDLVESAFTAALDDPLANADLLLAAIRGLARAPHSQKGRLKAMAEAAEAALSEQALEPGIGPLRWAILKEAVRAGATPSAPGGFHKLFEDALAAACPDARSLNSLLGRFKFREAKEPADGLARLEKVEKWLPFEVGRCFVMPGRGAGKVVETNFALEAVRLDFEASKGVSIPVGVAAKSLQPLPEGHFLREKLSDPAALAAAVAEDPAGAVRRLVESLGRPVLLTELRDSMKGLVADESWSAWWAAARKNPQVVVNGSGKSASVEWSASADAADATLLSKFERAALGERIEIFRKNQKRSAGLAAAMAEALAGEAQRLSESDPARAFEIALLVEKVPGITLALAVETQVLARPLALLPQLSDRTIREKALGLVVARTPAEAPAILSEWFFREEDGRTLEWMDRTLAELSPETRERTHAKILSSPRAGPRAFVWFAQKAAQDEGLRARLTPQILGRLLDAVSWDELGPLRTKVREMFDRTGLAAAWLLKQATLEDARAFLEALGRHNELEKIRRDGLVAAAEMRFPELRAAPADTFFVTAEAIERKRQELERILKVEIPENTKGIALAAAEGDLTENFEYKARRERQQLLSVRAGNLQEELTHARPIDPSAIDGTEVRPGARVTLATPSGSRSVVLLGPWDSRPEEAVYSYLSEAGQALLGKTAGESVDFLGERAVVETIEPWR